MKLSISNPAACVPVMHPAARTVARYASEITIIAKDPTEALETAKALRMLFDLIDPHPETTAAVRMVLAMTAPHNPA